MADPDTEPGYHQSEQIKLEIEIIRSYSRGQFDKFSKSGLLATGEKVQLETLVVFLREKKHAGETPLVNELAAAILIHSKNLISAIARSLSYGNNKKACQLIDEITGKMWDKLLNLDKSQKFWEANFKTSIKRTALNCQKHLARTENNEISLTNTDSGGNESDRLEYIPDFRNPDPVQNILIHEALGTLTLQERTVIILSVKEKWTHQEIAEQLGITDRTVRNILTRIDKKLEEWRKFLPENEV